MLPKDKYLSVSFDRIYKSCFCCRTNCYNVFSMAAPFGGYKGKCNYTTSWGYWKHPFGIPGVRSMFLKPKLHKESKNGFKTINYRCSPVMFFSKNFFWHQKSSEKSDGFTSNQFKLLEVWYKNFCLILELLIKLFLKVR